MHVFSDSVMESYPPCCRKILWNQRWWQVDIPSMVYTKFRVNFWVLAILQSKTIVHKGENRLYELLKYWLSVWKDSMTMCASLILIILHCVSIKIGFLMIKFLMNKDIIRLKFPSKTLLYNPMSSYGDRFPVSTDIVSKG